MAYWLTLFRRFVHEAALVAEENRNREQEGDQDGEEMDDAVRLPLSTQRSDMRKPVRDKKQE